MSFFTGYVIREEKDSTERKEDSDFEINSDGIAWSNTSFTTCETSQIVQSVMQDCQYFLSDLQPVCNLLLVQGPKITYNYSLSRWF